jgi:predicted metal-dependent hydrolase
VVVALEKDLFFAVRIREVALAAGARPEIVEDAEALWQAIDRWPDLVLLDLAADAGWEKTVRRAKNLPHTRPVPIVAFGSHVDTDVLKAARAAGCDHAWARSRFMSELPALLERTLHPPLREVAGCTETPPDLLVRGVEQFNHGEYWECHETLEGLWMAELRPVRDMYQGILQIGIAFHHLRKDNYSGCVKMLRRALPRLRGFPEVCQGVPLGRLARAARQVHDQVVALGPAHLDQFDIISLPRIEVDVQHSATTDG